MPAASTSSSTINLPGIPEAGYTTTRPRIAFFDYPDVFEDFYPRYGVTQHSFANEWDNTGNHAFLALLQRDIADVVWYEFSLHPELDEARHEGLQSRVKFVPSSWPHRHLWRLFYLPKMAWRWRGAYRVYATIASYLAPLSWRFLRSFWRERPDFVFVQDYASGKFDILILLASVMGIPLVTYHSGSQPDHYLGYFVRRFTLPRAARIIASGRAEHDMLVNRFHIPPDRLTVILTPIDTDCYAPLKRDEACVGVGLDPQRRYVLFVGRLDDEMKRVSAIIQAFAQLSANHPSVDLLIVGDGEDRPMLENVGHECCPDRIRFIGWVKDAEKKRYYYASADCLVLASKREGFPTVIGEAMACGTPVVSSRVGAVEELVMHGETGWLFTAGDNAGLANALDTSLSQSPAALETIRLRARTLAEQRVSPASASAALGRCFQL